MDVSNYYNIILNDCMQGEFKTQNFQIPVYTIVFLHPQGIWSKTPVVV